MSFATSQLEINTWLDAFILAPLIILGLHLFTKISINGAYTFFSLNCLFYPKFTIFGYIDGYFS